MEMAKSRRKKKKKSGIGWIIGVFAFLLLWLACMSGAAWFYLGPDKKEQPKQAAKSQAAPSKEEEAKLLAAGAKLALSSPPLDSLGKVTDLENKKIGSGSLYSLVWMGDSDQGLVLAEKAVQDAWRAKGGGVRVGVLYPDHAEDGERVRMVAGMTEIPVVEVLLKRSHKPEPAPKPPPTTRPAPKPNDYGGKDNTVAPAPDKVPPPKRPAPPRPAGGSKPRIAIIIDDIGNNMHDLEALLKIPVKLTFSVLPYERYTKSACERLAGGGQEIMLHMPMQPMSYPEADPGEGALLLTMNGKQIAGAMERALKAVPMAKGMNNHMGSAFTAEPERLDIALSLLKKRGLFFVDSRTSSRSEAYNVAVKLGLPAASRDVFLDHDQNRERIEGQLVSLAAAASERGYALGIGHPYPETIAVLSEKLPLLKSHGYEFVHASELVR